MSKRQLILVPVPQELYLSMGFAMARSNFIKKPRLSMVEFKIRNTKDPTHFNVPG